MMTVPAIERHVLDTPGDFVARPHANCYWLITSTAGAVSGGPARSSAACCASRALMRPQRLP
jgi:hypothetical protein